MNEIIRIYRPQILVLIGILLLGCESSRKAEMNSLGWRNSSSDLRDVFYGFIEYKKGDKDLTASSCSDTITNLDRRKIIEFGVSHVFYSCDDCEDYISDLRVYDRIVKKMNSIRDIKIVSKHCELSRNQKEINCECHIGLHIPNGSRYIMFLFEGSY